MKEIRSEQDKGGMKINPEFKAEAEAPLKRKRRYRKVRHREISRRQRWAQIHSDPSGASRYVDELFGAANLMKLEWTVNGRVTAVRTRYVDAAASRIARRRKRIAEELCDKLLSVDLADHFVQIFADLAHCTLRDIWLSRL